MSYSVNEKSEASGTGLGIGKGLGLRIGLGLGLTLGLRSGLIFMLVPQTAYLIYRHSADDAELSTNRTWEKIRSHFRSQWSHWAN